jgi:signal transduction histidine kinase
MLPAAPGTDGRDEPSRDGDRPRTTRAFSLARAVAGMFRQETPAKADSSGGVGRGGPSARIRGRLFRRYIALFVAVVCAALTVNALAEAWFLYQDRKQALVRIQHEQADAAAAKISQFISDIESHIGWTTQSSWSAETIARRRIDAQRLLRQVPAIAEFAQLDPDGREQLRISRVSLDAVGTGIDFSGDPEFTEAMAHKVYFGPVYFRSDSEPYMTIAMAGHRRDTGVSVAEVNLKFIWDVVSQIKVGQAGWAYVVDASGRLIAHPDMSLVLRKTDVASLEQVRAARGESRVAPEHVQLVGNIQGQQVLSAYAAVAPLNWFVFVELPISEAYAPLYAALSRSSVLFAGALLLAILAGFYLARRMMFPVRALSAGAERIGRGELSQRILVTTGDELEALADQFNDMASRLQASHAQLEESHADLELKVNVRTRDLARSLGELRALDEVSQAVNSTLDLETVLTTIVAKAVELSGTDAGAIYEFDETHATFRLRTTHGMNEGMIAAIKDQHLGLGENLLGQAAERREPLQVADLRVLAPSATQQIVLSAGYMAVLVVPLLRPDRIVGALVVRRKEPGLFEQPTIALLQTFAAQSVLAIQNARLFSELQEQGWQLELASRQKSRFLAAASHDLRQPLHALELWAGLLRSSLTSPQAVERWEKMNLSVVSLDTLFSGLLDLSRFDMGSITPDLSNVSLQRLFRGLDNDYRGEAEAKGIELRLADTALWVRSDPLWIERVLRNLLANAIKYTHKGSVAVWCEEGADTVRVVVQDTGMGISPSDQQNIFEEYYQVDNPGRRSDRGVGLGLAIVKRACDLLDHPISVCSEVGAGSEFSVVLPKRHSEVLADVKVSGVEAFAASLDGLVVVVIEDDHNTAQAMMELLEECHCVPVVHADADAAIAFLSSHELTPQAILADYRLENGLTGIDAIESVRAKYGDIPAALVSGELRIERLEQGRFGYPVMRKPLDPATIRSLLRAFRQSGSGFEGITP